MDKAQKQLVDTYFRKREIAIKQNESNRHTIHELRYLVDNNMIKIEDIPEDEVPNFLI